MPGNHPNPSGLGTFVSDAEHEPAGARPLEPERVTLERECVVMTRGVGAVTMIVGGGA